jgi:hypothetical protein
MRRIQYYFYRLVKYLGPISLKMDRNLHSLLLENRIKVIILPTSNGKNHTVVKENVPDPQHWFTFTMTVSLSQAESGKGPGAPLVRSKRQRELEPTIWPKLKGVLFWR